MPETFTTEELLAMSRVALLLQPRPEKDQTTALFVVLAEEQATHQFCCSRDECALNRIHATIDVFPVQRRIAMVEHLLSGDTLGSVQLRAGRSTHA